MSVKQTVSKQYRHLLTYNNKELCFPSPPKIYPDVLVQQIQIKKAFFRGCVCVEMPRIPVRSPRSMKVITVKR